jgi:hypothetical protein
VEKAKGIALTNILKGWDGYAWKDGEYIDDIQSFFDETGPLTMFVAMMAGEHDYEHVAGMISDEA